MLRGAAAFIVVAVSSLGCTPSIESTGDQAMTPPTPTRFCTGTFAFPDADGDGWGIEDGAVNCAGKPVPAGFATIVGDCDDSDPAVFMSYHRDGDGDGLGGAETICAGLDAPDGYQRSGEDCDDSDATLSRWWSLNDLDGDGVTLCDADVEQVCGSPDEVPAGASGSTTCPGDCDDSDPDRSWLHYEDQDGDGFGAATGETVCTGPAAPAGFGTWWGSEPDCDDTRADINHFGFEQWSDAIDSDCDGYLYPFHCEDEGCEPEPGPRVLDESCASADLLIDVRMTIECYYVNWVVVVANQGTEAASGFTLTLDAPVDPNVRPLPMVYSVQDTLLPGAQHSYDIPHRWLQGTVIFSVTAEGDDCNSGNDSMSQTGTARDCTR